jgi:hypothetical protein
MSLDTTTAVTNSDPTGIVAASILFFRFDQAF